MREIALREIVPGGPLRDPFIELHRVWIERRCVSWLELLRPEAMRPVLVLGAFDALGGLVGAIVAVWDEGPSECFDRLVAEATIHPVTARPLEGTWHCIALTTRVAEGHQHRGLGHVLLDAALGLLARTGHAEVCTLSPVIGIGALLERWPLEQDSAASGHASHAALSEVITRAALVDGRPFLPIMQLHLGAGARLERVLEQSRMEDRESLGMNLRFRYATDPHRRERQIEGYRRWVEARRREFEGASPACTVDGRPVYRAARTSALSWSRSFVATTGRS